MNFRREFDKAGKGLYAQGIMKRYSLPQISFHRMICLEERRAERSYKSILLMLLDGNRHGMREKESVVVNQKMISVLSPITRETDVIGWYKENSVVGLLFTEVATEEVNCVTAAVMSRVSRTLKSNLTPHQFADIKLSFHLLPEKQEREFSPLPVSSVYPEIAAVGSVSGS